MCAAALENIKGGPAAAPWREEAIIAARAIEPANLLRDIEAYSSSWRYMYRFA